MSNEHAYSIPIRYRRMENLHIVFWLFKDISWCMIWKPLGIAMIFPTLIIAIVISFRTRQFMSEVCHNVAIVFWITANAYWMVSEFLGFIPGSSSVNIPLNTWPSSPLLSASCCWGTIT